MNKAEIQALIEENLADFSNIIPERHREVENAILDYIDKPINFGTIQGIDVAGSIGSLTVTGDISACIASIPVSQVSKLLVTFDNEMPTVNYYVRMQVKCNSADILTDSAIGYPVFKVISTTQIEVVIGENTGGVQNLTLILEALPY
jgi:hypothetical protein